MRINTLAAPEDYDLALHMIERAAELLGVPIESEDGTTLPFDQLRDKYDAEWVRRTNQFGLETVEALIAEEEHDSVRLGGVVRDVHIGPRVWGELNAAGPEDELLDRLVEFMRHVQYVNADEDYFAANIMTLEKKTGNKPKKKKETTFAVFGAGVSYLFPSVEYLVVLGLAEADPILFVPYKKLPDLLAGRDWEWLDEEQTLVAPVSEEDWPELRRARGGTCRPGAMIPGTAGGTPGIRVASRLLLTSNRRGVRGGIPAIRTPPGRYRGRSKSRRFPDPATTTSALPMRSGWRSPRESPVLR